MDLITKIKDMAAKVADPKIAECEIQFLDDKSKLTTFVYLYDSAIENDEDIFYYAGGINGLISLTKRGVEDFIVKDIFSIE
jgi:hypothetical protein